MGSKISMPQAPAAPTPIDPGKSALDYMNSMADPALQNKILQSEQMYRPQYAALNLADLNTYLMGGGGQRGVLDLNAAATQQANQMQMDALSQQRMRDIADVEQYGGRATEALRNADPYQKALLQGMNQYALQSAGAAGRLSPEAQRNAEQQARLYGQARGRVGDTSTIAAEIMNREAAMGQRRQEAVNAAQMAFNANRMTSADPFQAILGRPSNAAQLGMAQTQFAQGMAGQQGPQLFDPNAGINLALGQNANLSNYNANIYGSQAAFAGAQEQARGAMIAGIAQGLGAAKGCWVAREVFGEDNPKWLYFRAWLYTKAPKWFYNLYLKHGERFAEFIQNKPVLKSVIRMWMNGRIKNTSQFNLA